MIKKVGDRNPPVKIEAARKVEAIMAVKVERELRPLAYLKQNARFASAKARVWKRLRSFLSRSVDLRNIDPATIRPGLQAELGELHALRALQQVPRERIVLHHMAEEELPLDLERVVVNALVRH